jgi:hypothetical protein
MNWKRIWTGTLAAGLIYFLLGGVISHGILGNIFRELQLLGQMRTPKPAVVILLALQDLLIGLILTWLYAFARPRMGPGPKTALFMGTIAWALISIPNALFQWIWLPWPASIPLVQLTGNLVRTWAAIYVAGWQYIERAP